MGSSDTEKTLESYGPDIGERTSGLTRVREWVLVEGDRLVVAALVSIAAFWGFSCSTKWVSSPFSTAIRSPAWLAA